MQKKVVVFAVMAAALGARAELDSKISEINSAVRSVGQPQTDCESCTTMVAGKPEDDGSMMESCVQSICANSPVSLAQLAPNAYEKASRPQPEFEKEIQPLIRAIATTEAKGKLLRAQAMRSWIKTAPPLSDPGGLKVFNLLGAYGEIEKLKYEANSAQSIPSIDRALTRAEFPHLDDAQFDKKMIVMSKLITIMSKNVIPVTDPAMIRLAYGDRFIPAVNDALAQIENQKKRLESNPEFRFLTELDSFQTLSSTKNLRTALTSGQVDPARIADLNRISSTMHLFGAMADDTELRSALQSSPIDVKKRYAELGIEKLLQERVNVQNEVLRDKAPIRSSMCEVAFALAQEILPTQAQIDSFKNRIAAVKNKFVVQTTGLVCELASAEVSKKLLKLDAIYPLTQEQYIRNLKEALKREEASAQNARVQLEAIDRSPNRDAIYSIGMSTLQEASNSATDTSDEICAHLIVDPTPDATTAEDMSLVVGPMPLRHSDQDGISHHEMGHKMLDFLEGQSSCDRSEIRTVGQCLIGNHTEFNNYEAAFAKEAVEQNTHFKYGKEDWADLLSARVEEKTNSACLYSTRTKKEDYKKLSLRNESAADSHSSPLFRLLHIEFLRKGKIPQQCVAALSARGERAQFKNCLAK